MISTFEYSKAFFYHYNVEKHNEALLISNQKQNDAWEMLRHCDTILKFLQNYTKIASKSFYRNVE